MTIASLLSADLAPNRPASFVKSRRWMLVALPLGALFLLGVRAAWFFPIDDSFITFRYSANLAAGRGPVWNVGEDPVEGFTNFLWMLWHTPFAWLGLDLPTVAKLTSLAAGAVILVLLVRHAWQRNGPIPALVAGGAFVLFLPTYFHLTSGLETVAFAAIVLRIVIVALRIVDGQAVHVWEPPLLLVLAGMLRPDDVLAALPALAVWLWLSRRDRRAWLWTAGAAAVGLGYFAWRWSFYGHLFPNTFYVKFGNVAAGSLWLDRTTWVLAPLLVLTASLLLRRSTRRAGFVLCATVAPTYLTYVVSGPTMDYLYRFAYHAFPVLCLGAGLAVAPVQRRWTGAGAIPCYSGWTTIDFIGLNDEPIAHGADVTIRVTNSPSTAGSTESATTSPGNPAGLGGNSRGRRHADEDGEFLGFSVRRLHIGQ